MTRSLPEKPDITLLKKHAKKLLKQFRGNDADAHATVKSLHPKPQQFSGLRDAQLVVARRYGFESWAALSDAVELAQYSAQSPGERATLFIRLACVQYNGSDSLRNYQRAQQLLLHYPDIANAGFYTALVTNNTHAVQQYLEKSPELASATGGPLDWPALLYVTYSRIPTAESDSSACDIARLLLQHGADPDSHVLLQGTYRFTALTGAMGEGELGVNQPPHQHALALAQLLLNAGANPNDGQGLYNTMFTASGDEWLALLLDHGLNNTHLLNWDDPNRESGLATLDYQLATAVDQDNEQRVQLLLDAGADVNTHNSYDGRTIYTNALLRGHRDMAERLLESGAKPETLALQDQFRLACVDCDDAALKNLLDVNPQLKSDAALLHHAAEHAPPHIYQHLIGTGFDINGQANHGRTLLHQFALKNDTTQIRFLLDRGAETNLQDSSHSSTPVGFAAFAGSYDAMRLLLDKSGSFINVVCCAYLERAQTLVKESPESVFTTTERGNPALHVIGAWLQDEPDENAYRAFIELLLASGANIKATSKDGQTAVEFNQARGAESLAELLREYGG